MTQKINYKIIIQQGIPLIQKWSNKQPQHIKETDDYKELQRVIKEIEQEKDYSQDAYEDIRFVLRPFEELLSLNIKRYFNISTMDQYSMFITTRWFETIEDHINLVLSTRRFKENMTKFHYNPISVTSQTVKFFPNVETLYSYKENDEYLEGGRIQRYVDLNRKVSYYEYEEMKEKVINKGKEIEFKRIVWTKYDTDIEYKKQNPKNKRFFKLNITIPEGVKEIEENCFDDCLWNVNELTIPSTVKIIPRYLLMKLCHLKKLIIPHDVNILVYTIFYDVNNCLYSNKLPESIEILNNEEFKFKSFQRFTIPTNVTKLSDFCFANSFELKEIKGLEHVKEIGKGCFINCRKFNKYQYPKVEENIDNYFNELLQKQQRKQLEEWTGLKCGEIIFNSDIDDLGIYCDDYTTIFEKSIAERSQITFVFENEEGEIFGYYLNTPATITYYEYKPTDLKSFHFNLFSNGRLPGPMKFEIKHTLFGAFIRDTSYEDDVTIGDIHIEMTTWKNKSQCYQNENNFDYHGIKNALCGKIGYFTPKRIIVIQMV